MFTPKLFLCVSGTTECVIFTNETYVSTLQKHFAVFELLQLKVRSDLQSTLNILYLENSWHSGC